MTRFIVLVLSTFALVACDTSGPELSDVSLVANPNPAVPLAAILRVTGDEPSTLTINIDDGERQWSVCARVTQYRPDMKRRCSACARAGHTRSPLR